jgi:hypothetical protein
MAIMPSLCDICVPPLPYSNLYPQAEERSREDRKRRQEQAEEERLKAAEREKQEEEQRLEEERKAREEKERQEHEEYLKMKAAFTVEEEGYEEGAGEDEQNSLLQEFINYIKVHNAYVSVPHSLQDVLLF